MQFNHLRKKIADCTLPQDNFRGKLAFCASAYKYIFNTCRIPAPGADVVGMWSVEKYNHMIVIHKNCIYSVELDDQTVGSLVKTFEHIKEDAKNFPNEKPVGVLTAVHRDVWTGARKHLISDLDNKATMAVIESSAFAVCLDDHTPGS